MSEIEALDRLSEYESIGKLKCIADDIRREIEERYVELPVDMQNIPWHIGDYVRFHGEVKEMLLNENGWSFVGISAIDPGCHYHRPRTLDDVLHEFGVACADNACVDRDLVSEYADEIRDMIAGDTE